MLLKVGDTFPCCVKEFIFNGKKPEYFAIKAGGNMLLYTKSFTELHTNMYKINFFENDLSLPLHLVKLQLFEFISNVQGPLFITESNETFENNCEINLPNGKVIIIKNGLIGLRKSEIVAELTLDEFISFKLSILYNKLKLNNNYLYTNCTECLDILHYIIYREDDSYKYITTDIRKNYEKTVIILILENLYENKYKKIYETLPFKLQNNLVDLGFSVEKGKYYIYGLN